MSRAHARNAPSDASAWSRCLGKLNFEEAHGLADKPGGPEAARGTILHDIAERCLVEGREAYEFVGQEFTHDDHTVEIDEEMADAIQSGLDRIDEIPGQLFVEKRVDLSRWMPGQFGTTDVGICDTGIITIWDWKFGFNPVSPVDNDQLKLYALGFWENIARHKTKAKKFRLIIWQPFAPNGGGEWETTLDELLDFGEWIGGRAALTKRPDAPRTPGPKQCAYCEGAKTHKCPEYVKYNLEMIVDDFDSLDETEEEGLPPRLVRPETLTPERRAYIVRHKAMISKFLESLHDLVLDDALKGRPTPTLKAVYGNAPPRRYVDKAAAEADLTKLLEEEAFSRKVISPTQAEKALPPRVYARFAAKHVTRPDPKPILVDEGDARDPIPTLDDLFED